MEQPTIRLGTSGFTATGWEGSFYPNGLPAREQLTREAEARRGETQRRQAAARLNWRPSDQPAWLAEETYREKIQPRLAEITVPIISSALGVSKAYATDIRAGRRCPHPRHWLALAQLVGVSPNDRSCPTVSL
jgi:hypothetical protein